MREEMLARIRSALKPSGGEAPAVRLSRSEGDRVKMFRAALEALGGKVIETDKAEDQIQEIVNGRSFVTSKEEFSRDKCSAAEFGIAWADCALAETGTLVYLAGPRLVSLLPPRHIAVIERDRILESLDELLSIVPRPGDRSSAMTLVTGPSRTADIEMRLVRGVHGPGEITVIVSGVTV